ncbi:MAG: hypothetical protein A3H50_01490 [Candidatus Levybacteria bacterium RIFCSPLOWO2_02_FULL_37_10]|nr:MAG: hypothetical protein A2860_03200 [Candidatus Levybacteria bacterium RIFCSPHIGHO2_01_FULL_37_33]OGH43342.1 MAG: hypothetical protein A3H50_01490 [Candidatus Levybacteria bacterium RIFCSPLOWO2_02_FULL_37_10]
MNEIQLAHMKKRVLSGIRTKKAEPFYFDDCYVCQATKKAEKEGKDLSVEELTEIFRKANEQN